LFSDQFSFQAHSLINFVGGGGKTGLIQKLMAEYCSDGPVLYTTTTRIHPPEPGEGLVVLSSDNIPLLKRALVQVSNNCSNRSYKLVVTRRYISPNLLRGVPPDFSNALDRSLFPILLNEADGAAGFSLKLPRVGEPVLMENAEYLVPVIGIDCLYQPMGPEVLFRWQSFSGQFSLRAGERITPELAAEILMHKQGVCKDWKPGITIIPFINKVDGVAQEAAARDLAQSILKNSNFPVARVAYGSVLQGKSDFMALP
jgi:probable selenium-dependent hydroxylase accessory protein YqeC